jgi:hypothetical protein
VVDLRVEDGTLADAQAALRSAGNRLAPAARILKGTDCEAAGAAPLVAELRDADEMLAAELGTIGQALVELAAHVTEIGAAFGQVDQDLSRQAGAVR